MCVVDCISCSSMAFHDIFNLERSKIMSWITHPYDVEALETWNRPKVVECFTTLTSFIQEELNDWECYERFCIECDEHDRCFGPSEWFQHLLNE